MIMSTDFIKTNGIGIIARETKPNSDEAHLAFKASNICVANN
jgi:hypothetical protein